MTSKRQVRALRTAVLGVLATLALFWGAVDIVGVSADKLLDYVWLSFQGVFLLALIAVPSGFLLRWLWRRP